MKEYNKSVQILKLLAAFFVVLLHALGHGTVLQNVEIHTVSYYVSWMLESLAYVAVDIFIISMGYSMIHRKRRSEKILNIYFLSLWYMAIGLIVSLAITKRIDVNYVIKTVFPFSRESYGFVTAYIGVYILSPLINYISCSLDKKKRTEILLVIIILGALYPTLQIGSDYWGLNYGYSLIWFICLYYIGGYLHDYPIHLKSNIWLCLYLGISCCSAVIGFLAREVSEILHFSFNGEGVLLHYNSITVTIAAISLFSCFIEQNQKIQSRLLWFISNTTLGIYLLHDNEVIRKYIWLPIEGQTNIVYIMVYVLCVFIGCLLFDTIRSYLFSKLKVDKLSKTIVGYGVTIIQKIESIVRNTRKDVL